MEFQLKMLMLAFITSVIIAIFVIPILKKLKIGQIERSDGPQSHLKKQGTPTMGGIIMLLSIIIVSIVAYLYYYKTNIRVANRLIPLVLAAVGFGIIGFIDDFKKLVLKNTKGLKPSHKMLGLLIISTAYVVYIVTVLKIETITIIPIFKTAIELPIWIFIPFAIVVMLATTNAVNLTDGVDGLSTSVSAIIIATLTAIAIRFGTNEVVVYGCITCGAALGFLLFNMHKAKVFMGDTGSLMLGGIISAMAVYLQMPLILIIIALIPVLESLSVILQVAYFKKTGNRIFKMAPLHHHFELSGWKENTIVSVFSIITLILCVFGISSI